VVFDPNQIHILGSEKDKEKFRKFIKKEKLLNELNKGFSGSPLKYALEIANVENTEELVDKLSDFETKAGFEKVFLKLKNITNLKEIKVKFKSLNYLGDLDPETLEGPTNAYYMQSTKTIYIDSTYSNSAQVGEFYITIMHELFHHVFRGADMASGTNIIYGLSSVKNTIEKLPIHNKYRNLYSLVLHNISKEESKNHYGLSNVNEFISESYSNPQFQKFLKSVELKNKKSVSSKATDLLLSVLTLNNRVSVSEISEKDAFSAFQKIDLESLDLLEDFENNMKEFSNPE